VVELLDEYKRKARGRALQEIATALILVRGREYALDQGWKTLAPYLKLHW
jgi:hypothetical protein